MLLRSTAGRIVIDKTNLSGLYDFRIQFAQQTFTATPSDAVGNPSAPSLFIAGAGVGAEAGTREGTSGSPHHRPRGEARRELSAGVRNYEDVWIRIEVQS